MIEAKRGFIINNTVSFSQFNVWRKSKKQYIKQYILGEKWEGNKYTRRGSEVHDILDSGSSKPDEQAVKDILDSYISKYAIAVENEVRVVAEENGIKYESVFDKVSTFDDYIFEIKTGLEKSWDKDIVNNHYQLYFYRKVYQILHSVIPKQKLIHFIMTSNGELTGQIKVYDFEFDSKIQKKFDKELKEFFEWCKNITQEEVDRIMSETKEVDPAIEEKANRLIQIKSTLAELEKEDKELRKEVCDYLVSNNTNKYILNDVSFYYTSKKVWEYPEKITKLQTQLDELMKTPKILKLQEKLSDAIEDYQSKGTPKEIKNSLVIK